MGISIANPSRQDPDVVIVSINFICNKVAHIQTVQATHEDLNLDIETQTHTDSALARIVETKTYISVPCECGQVHEIQIISI